MQAPWRRAHRRLWPALTLVLALGLVLGVAMKQERPVEPGAVIEGARQ
ncbi:MAG: hypothetical protein NXI18_06165 [Alphaproteobacteria bacterium]|nr:hypothetical protein [Alphaproteobacteria bacterium]